MRLRAPAHVSGVSIDCVELYVDETGHVEAEGHLIPVLLEMGWEKAEEPQHSFEPSPSESKKIAGDEKDELIARLAELGVKADRRSSVAGLRKTVEETERRLNG